MEIKSFLWPVIIVALTVYSVKDPLNDQTLKQLFFCYAFSLVLFGILERKRTVPLIRELGRLILLRLRPLKRVLTNIDRLRIFPFSLAKLIPFDLEFKTGTKSRPTPSSFSSASVPPSPMPPSQGEFEKGARPLLENLLVLESEGKKGSPSYHQTLMILELLKGLLLTGPEKNPSREEAFRTIRAYFAKNFFDFPLQDSLVVKAVGFSREEWNFHSLVPLKDQFFGGVCRKLLGELLASELGNPVPGGPLLTLMAQSYRRTALDLAQAIFLFLLSKQKNPPWELVVSQLIEGRPIPFALLEGEKPLSLVLQEGFFPEGKTVHRIPLLKSLERSLQLVEDIEMIKREEFPSSRELAESYKILQCHPHNSENTLKRRFNKLAMEHHPDRLPTENMPEEKLRKINASFGKIHEAYQTVRKTKKQMKKILQHLMR